MPRIPARNRFATLAATALGASLLAVATAPAAIAASTVTKVRLSGLDLSSDAGRTALSARIDRAARAHCARKAAKGESAAKACLTTTKTFIRRQIAERLDENRLGG